MCEEYCFQNYTHGINFCEVLNKKLGVFYLRVCSSGFGASSMFIFEFLSELLSKFTQNFFSDIYHHRLLPFQKDNFLEFLKSFRIKFWDDFLSVHFSKLSEFTFHFLMIVSEMLKVWSFAQFQYILFMINQKPLNFYYIPLNSLLLKLCGSWELLQIKFFF